MLFVHKIFSQDRYSTQKGLGHFSTQFNWSKYLLSRYYKTLSITRASDKGPKEIKSFIRKLSLDTS